MMVVNYVGQEGVKYENNRGSHLSILRELKTFYKANTL
jgi:hypothetical protein